MLDLPKHSVLVAGLDHWRGSGEEIVEPRLIEKLKYLLELPALKLYAPPPDPDDPTAPPTGITAWQFPEWFIVQDVEPTDVPSGVRSRMLVHRMSLTKGKYIDENKKWRAVVSVRFVRACRCRPCRRHRLVQLRPRWPQGMSAATLDRRTRHQRRSVRSLDSLRMQGSAVDRRSSPDADAGIGNLQRRQAVARP